MTESSRKTQIIVALIGVFGVLAAAVIGNWDRFFGPTTTAPPSLGCSLSGQVFDEESGKPLPGLIIGLHTYEENVRESKLVKFNAATTGVDGTFKVDCRGIARSEFPLNVVVTKTDPQPVDYYTSVRVDYGYERTDVNIPFPSESFQ